MTQAKIDSTPVGLVAAADLSTKLFRFGKHTATGINVCTVAGERADGIIGSCYKKTPAAGDTFDFYVDRVPLLESGGVYASGVDLTTDALGRGVAAAAGDVVNAVSIDASTVAAQYTRVRPPYTKAGLQSVANEAISPAVSLLDAGGLYVIDLPDAVTTTYVFINGEKIEIIDAWVIKDGAGAANTVQITDSADAAITNAMAAAVDKTVTHAGTIDKAKRVLAALAGFKVIATRAAGTMAGQLFILAVKRP